MKFFTVASSVLFLTFRLVCQVFTVLNVVKAQSTSPITTRPTNGHRLVPNGEDHGHDRPPVAPFNTPVPVVHDIPAPVSLSPTLHYTHPPNPRRQPHPNNRGPVKIPPPPTPSPTLPPPCSYSCSTSIPVSANSAQVFTTACLPQYPQAQYYNCYYSDYQYFTSSWFTFQAPKNCAASVSLTLASGSFLASFYVYTGGTCPPTVLHYAHCRSR
jgi:hypothetical protein